jgi:hypothetical protein
VPLPQPVAWIFQAAEHEYDLWAAVHGLTDDVWLAREKQGARSMRRGQPVFFWKAGSGGGLFATGQITDLPTMRPAPPWQVEFWPPASRAAAETADLRVGVKYLSRLPKGAITRADLRSDPVLSKQRPIAPTHVGTNFGVSAAAYDRLTQLIAGLTR